MEGRGMSKRHTTSKPAQMKAADVPAVTSTPAARTQPPAVTVDPVPPERTPRIIEAYRHCPICWNGHGGYGSCKSTQGRVRYYKCDKTTKPEGPGPCGHTWTATVTLETIRIEHRIVTLDGERHL